MQGGMELGDLKVLSKPNYSVILWFSYAKAPSLGEESQKAGTCALQAPHEAQEMCTVTWWMTPCSQDRSVPCYPGACLWCFRDWPAVLEPGSSSACVGEARGSERGKAASNFSEKPTPIPEGSRSCSGARWTLWKEFSGLSVINSWRAAPQQRKNEVLLCKRVLPDKLFQWKTPPQAGEVHSNHRETLGACAFFFPTSIQMQLQLLLVLQSWVHKFF